jgi:hypothetical protein
MGIASRVVRSRSRLAGRQKISGGDHAIDVHPYHPAFSVAQSFDAVAQHHTSRGKHAATGDAALIANALAAAPPEVGRDATIMAMEKDGKLRMLRQGTGAFTCLPDDPSTPGNDPMCLDQHGIEWLKALLEHRNPPDGQVWLGYMLISGSDASNDDPYVTQPAAGKRWIATGPHIMVGGAGVTKMMDAYPKAADNTKKPYIMWPGTPYEHIMIPIR